MFKKIMNLSEAITYNQAQEICERNGAVAYPKVRLADILPIENSGISDPPEDVGGAMGYALFLQIISQPSHPEYEEMKTWSGGNFSPTLFDKDAVDEELLRRFMK
ncbi:plasmid pRiA4b ORF-3 family protein (plasmid) [Alicyclobacillus sp. TC]|uniref:Plasmid pRiA4b Orf3-like domain-containing protein n=1 Tax=Alicyclobacillus tolerans TaxID=90970 RepID=A0ABT9LYM8_9BACL|nr:MULTISPECIES: hypothetical protein [Alicyclobacillus]MDP9729367.1 hypothetical protein [Alicyclobacillus tengchongensis]QRF24863.1 plasmid pRiA4b ORF-3 family protein [Alicyclobacillus sp. TC]